MTTSFHAVDGSYIAAYRTPGSSWDLYKRSGNGGNGGAETEVKGFITNITIGLGRAVSRDTMQVSFCTSISLDGFDLLSSLATLVAGLASSVQRTTVRSSAIPRDVSELAASIAFHCLSLAVSCKVVGTTALVAGSWTRATCKSTTRSESATESTTRRSANTTATWNRTWTSWAGAGALKNPSAIFQCNVSLKTYSQVSWLTTVVASTAGSSTTKTKGWAVGLDVT